ncbi:hypothetical protein [Streptomyces mirabilis]|uniref:hypothetical protein n=1 Tax=Streptomyces mirabilis TaxID=68239 RepID=UPI0036EFDCE4
MSDIPGRAEKTDPNLVNPWGLARTPAGENFVSDNGSDKATTYSGALDNQPVNILPQVVSIPEGGTPTGVARNDTDAFRFTDSGTGKSGVAGFLFAGEDGDVFAFNPEVNPTNAVRVAHEDSDGETAVFKGLTIVPGEKEHGEVKGHGGTARKAASATSRACWSRTSVTPASTASTRTSISCRRTSGSRTRTSRAASHRSTSS